MGSSLAYFSFGGESLTENLEKTLEIARDLVLKPRFSKEDFEVVKHSVLGSKKAQKDNDQFLVYAFTRANFYPESHPYGKLSRGSTKSIESIKLEEVQAFYKKFVVILIKKLLKN